MILYITNQYLSVLFYSFLALMISVLIMFLVSLLMWRSSVSINKEKLSAYECGFNPFAEARYKFEVKFYLVSLLFIIFDVEIIYLFPWSVVITIMPVPQVIVLVCFLMILFIGLIYEIRKKALEF